MCAKPFKHYRAKPAFNLEWGVPLSWEHMGMPSNCDLLCRHPYNLWDASAMEVRATMRPLTLKAHRQTGADNAKHRDGLEETEKKKDETNRLFSRHWIT